MSNLAGKLGLKRKPAQSATSQAGAAKEGRAGRSIAATAHACRQKVTRRAWLSAGVAAVPLPGLDIAVDAGNVMRMLQEINQAFGLTPEDIEALAPKQRFNVYQILTTLSGSAVGRVVSHQVVALMLKSTFRRLVAKQVARGVPLLGTAVAASLSFTAIRFIGMRHIEDCVAVARVARPSART